jgi:PAS domain S-box-containing protein
MGFADGIGNEKLLELFFSKSMDGFFFMMLDEPVEWNDRVDKSLVLDYVFEHQRMTKVNSAMVAQFNASSAADLIGVTPTQFFAHDIEVAKERWRKFFDSGHIHNETTERRLDGSEMRIEGDYIVIYDDRGRIAGHFGIQRDVTDRHIANEEIRSSREQLRALASRLQQVREEERTAVAREIHDELGQALTALKLDIAWMAPRVSRNQVIAAHCGSIMERIDETMTAVRRIATELRPSVLDQLGLEAAIDWQGREFNARTGIDVTMELSVDGMVIPDDLASSVFRILQESLTNITRHAKATRVDIGLIQAGPLLTLEVTDNGIGWRADTSGQTTSLGLIGMRERAIACGGVLCVTGSPGVGTSVLLVVPVRDQA